MKKVLLSLAVCGALTAGVTVSVPLAQAKPGGCLKYGAAGAVAGHVAGHHGFKGALAGCAVGMYQRHKYNQQQRMMHRDGM